MRKLERKKLDEIGKIIAKADARSPRDIDSITSNPELFDSVLARVKLASTEPAPRHFFRAPIVAGSFASIALVAALTLAFVVFKSDPGDIVVADPTPEAPRRLETTKFPKPDSVVDIERPRSPAPMKAERISTKPVVKIGRPKPAAPQQVRYEGDFYALSYAGDPNETERGGRIVRLDVSRSTLFAMGIDVPLENESGTVKADLLIGNDGVTRAIRVVK